MSRKLIALILFFISNQHNAQKIWTLKECIEYGLKNNRNNTIYSNQKMAADAKAREALSAYLPKISLTTTLDDNLKVQESVIPPGLFSKDPIRVAFTQKYNANGVAQLDQTIYDQGLLTGLKANKFNKQQAELKSKQSKETIIYNISTAYFQISVYKQQLNYLLSNKDRYNKQIKILQLQVNKGVALQKDVDKINVDDNNNTSRIGVSESNLKLAENQLKFEMGYPIEKPLEVDIIMKDSAPFVLTSDTTSDFFVGVKTDYQLSELNIKLLNIQQDQIRAERLPKLTGYARYGAVGFGNTLNKAYSELSAFSAIGLKLSIPILDFYKNNAQYTQAKIELINAEEQLKIDKEQYKLDYQNATTKVIQEQSNVDNNKRNVVLAESVLKTTDLQLQKGVTDLTDWLNTQNSLKEAQNNYLNSLYDYLQARIALEKTAGTLLIFYDKL